MRRTLIASAVVSVSSIALIASATLFVRRIDEHNAAATLDLNAAVRKVSLIRSFLPEFAQPAHGLPSRRWQRQLGELRPVLASIPAFDQEASALKARILEESMAVEALFERLAGMASADRNDRDMVAGQLDVRTASMVSDILAMNDLTATHVVQQKRFALAVMVAAVVVLAGVIVGLLVVLQRRVVSPVMRLQRAVARFGKGEFDEPVSVSGTNEVAALAAGFDYMRTALRERMAELDAARALIEKENETLAMRVEERTGQLKAANRDLEQAGRAKDLFLATMSHEIRTPMNGVIGLVEVLAHSGLSEHQADLVRTIRQSASTLLSILDDILDYSKIEAGRLDIESKPLSVAELVEGLCSSLVPVANQRGVDLSIYVSPQVPERVLSDDVRLRQVIYNLVGNAIKFSSGNAEQRGLVRVRVDVANATAPLLLAFRVEDNGIGMAPETLKRLFQPFAQAEVSTTRVFGGTGLGLAICRRLVTLMHGGIDVQSEPGIGSTFSVVLPFDVPSEQPTAQLPDIAGLDCVLVRDEWLDFDAVQSYLGHAGARLHVADTEVAAAAAGASLRAPVVIQGAAPGSVSTERLHQVFAAVPDARHLLVMRGQHPHIRVQAPDIVILDGDALRRKVLLRAVAVAGGRASPEAVQETSGDLLMETFVAPSVDDARAEGRLILIAEDDDINQKVILQQLGLLGYAAEVADDGAAALERWRAGRYGLLLTDLHMPEMDGYALAESIRGIEHDERRPRLPIVALTANALRGEAARVRAAGMDDILTKPVPLKQLQAALARWLPAAPAPERHAPAPATAAKPPVSREAEPDFDIDAARAVIGGDEGAMRDFLADYLRSADRMVAELRDDVVQGDLASAAGVAHRLKSSSRAVGALRMGQLCAELEGVAKAHKPDAAETLGSIEKAMARARTSIAEVLGR